MTIMTNVQKLKLDEIAIPGCEGGFNSDIHAIVDIDNHKVYRIIPKNKIFISNQMAVAHFEESAEQLNYNIGSITERSLFNGSQMVKIYDSDNLGEGFQLRHYLWNAYNKGTGYILCSLLMHTEQLIGRSQNCYFPFGEWSKVILTDNTQEQTKEALENIILAAGKYIHYLQWTRTQTNRTGAWPEHFAPFNSVGTQSTRRNFNWRVNRTEGPMYHAWAFLGYFLFSDPFLNHSSASPRELSRQKRITKFLTIPTPSFLTEGYSYEETTTHTHEQNIDSNRDSNTVSTNDRNIDPLSGDVPRNDTAYDLSA